MSLFLVQVFFSLAILQANEKPLAVIRALEARLHQNPKNIEIRKQLLKYYLPNPAKKTGDKEKWVEDALWIVENKPDAVDWASSPNPLDRVKDSLALDSAEKVWNEKLRLSTKANLFGNAGFFFENSRPEIAEKYFSKASALEPKNSKWSQRLGLSYLATIGTQPADHRKELAVKAFEKIKKAKFAAPPGHFQNYWIFDYAKLAYEVGANEDSKNLTDGLLKIKTDPFLNYSSHLLRGRIAVNEGDLNEANAQLLDSLKLLNDVKLFGPNMNLAQDLLAKDQKQSVLNYLDKCKVIWKNPEILRDLSGFRQSIVEGKAFAFPSKYLN